ncbi:helix-turn-helix domain-containing protein [Halobacillus salinus]|uniref:XRE family transcriptional regulator n=1 Tax=Halobacillus salinus TaxID=192814 RepID=A0A4Z0GZ34_9BACI|nr:helix-turn-helix transcriptional regulator [Halobacillus salinus]TGB02454.1 XRE family transcriptional regulator [Halobacillus salinus]
MSDYIRKYADLTGKDHVENLQWEGRVAAQIKKHRKKIGYSQQELADKAGIPKSTIGRIEAGLTSPRTETLYKLSRVLGIPFVIDGTEGTQEDEYSKA